MDDESRKIGMMIAAFDAEHSRLQGTVEALGRRGDQLQREVRGAAREAVEAALKELHPQLTQAGRTLIDLQRLSLWRAAWQHGIVALVAIVVTLLAVWRYVPPVSEIMALRAERDQLQASLDGLSAQGARIKRTLCGAAGEKKRLCVLVPVRSPIWNSADTKEAVYVIPVGY